MEQVTETQELGLTKIINDQLVKENITDKVIAELKEKYLPLKLKDLNDRDGYDEIVAARKHCKNLRVMTVKVCKMGREDAVAIQKAWITKEKEIVADISVVEDHLEKQEKEYEAEKERIKQERAQKVEEQYLNRVSTLTKMGALVSEGMFILNTVSHEITEIREVDDDVFNELILPKFKVEYDKMEAERMEEDRIKKQKEEELRLEREKFEEEKRQFQLQQDQLKKQQEELEQRQRIEREEAERKMQEQQKKRFEERAQVLIGLGMLYNFKLQRFEFDDIIVDAEIVDTYTEEEWTMTVQEKTPVIETKKRQIEEENRRIKEGRERFYQLERVGVTVHSVQQLAHMDDEVFRKVYEDARAIWDLQQKEKYEAEMQLQREQEQVKREEELQKLTDKEKWVNLKASLQAVNERFSFKSPHYNKKFNSLKELLEEI